MNVYFNSSTPAFSIPDETSEISIGKAEVSNDSIPAEDILILHQMKALFDKSQKQKEEEKEDRDFLQEGIITQRVIIKLQKYATDNNLDFYETFEFYPQRIHANCADVFNPLTHIKVLLGYHSSAKPYWNAKSSRIEDPLTSVEYTIMRCAIGVGYAALAGVAAAVIIGKSSSSKEKKEAEKVSKCLEKMKQAENITEKRNKEDAENSSMKKHYLKSAENAAKAAAHAGGVAVALECPPVAAFEGYQVYRHVKKACEELEKGNNARDRARDKKKQ